MESVSKFYNKRIKNNDLLKKSVSNFFIQVLGLMLSYLIVYIISKKYNATTLGYYTLANVALQLLSMLVLSGMNTASVQMIPGFKNEHDSRSISVVFFKTLLHTVLFGILVSFLFYLLSGFIAGNFMKKPEMALPYQMISYAILPCSLITLLSDFLRANNKIIWWAIISKVLVFLIFIIIILSFGTKAEINYPIYVFSISNFLTLIPICMIFIFFIKKKSIILGVYKLYQTPSYKEIRKLAFPMFLFSSTLLLGNWITTLMVGALGTTADTGIYRVLDRISSLNVLVLTAVNAVLAPKIAGAFADKNIELLKRHVNSATKLIFWTSLPIQIIIVLFHNQILEIFGEEFKKGSTALIITMTGQIINSLAGPVGQVLNMTHNQIFLRNASMVGLVITVLLSWVLIPVYGINGAAIAALVNSLFINIICLVRIKNKFSFNALYNPFKIRL